MAIESMGIGWGPFVTYGTFQNLGKTLHEQVARAS